MRSMPPVAIPPSFVFTASKPGGKSMFGLRSAKNRNQLAEQLKRERVTLKSAYQLPKWMAQPARIGGGDQLILNEQLAQLLSRGVPLVEAMEVAGETVSSGARPMIERMRDLVASGTSFAEACRIVGGFDTVSVADYRAAERSGDLAGAAKQIAITVRRTRMVAGKAITLLIYPIIVLAISLLVAFGLMVGVVPKLGVALAEIGEVPWFSKIIIGFGTFLADNFTLIMFLMGGGLIALLVLRAKIIESINRLSRTLPLLREVIMAQESVRFFSVMAAMSRSGVPLADALGTANQAINHPKLRKQMERLRTRLIEGGALRNLIEEVDAFPVATRRLLIAAEKAGDLEAVFNQLATDMTDEVDRRSQRFLAVLQPLLIVFMFAIIGSLLIALLLPLITMSSTIGGR